MILQSIIDFIDQILPDDDDLKELMENIIFPVL